VNSALKLLSSVRSVFLLPTSSVESSRRLRMEHFPHLFGNPGRLLFGCHVALPAGLQGQVTLLQQILDQLVGERAFRNLQADDIVVVAFGDRGLALRGHGSCAGAHEVAFHGMMVEDVL